MTKVICTTLLVETSPQALPLGAACVASAIKNDSRTKNLCDVSLLCFSLEDKFSADEIAARLMEAAGLKTGADNSNPAPIVLFSVYVWNAEILRAVSLILKKHGIVTIAGGPEITAKCSNFNEFGYVIAGEGEEKAPLLIECLIKGKQPDEKLLSLLLSNSSCCLTQKIPSPYLDGTLDPSLYGGALWELARGCPFKCTYCFESKGEKTVRQFPLERITKELELFAKKKVPQVFVLDPTYNADKKRAIELLKLIAKKTPDTFYYFEARAEFIDRQLAHAFTSIPCALQIGLQSTNEETLKLINRPYNLKLFSKNIGFLNQEGVTFGLDLIYGLPAETFKTFKEGINYAISLYPNNLEIFCLSVLPGTEIYDKSKEQKLNFEDYPPYHVINTDVFSAQDIQKAGELALACSFFYNNGRAVPWFNSICRVLKIKPALFFEKFHAYMSRNHLSSDCAIKHQEIQKHQLAFIFELLKEKQLEKYSKAISDIISFYGALSRVQDTSDPETLTLNYPAEYVDSQYASDIAYFTASIKQKKNTIRIFKNGRFADWR